MHEVIPTSSAMHVLSTDEVGYRYGVEGEFLEANAGDVAQFRPDVGEVNALLTTRTSPRWMSPEVEALPTASVLGVKKRHPIKEIVEYHSFVEQAHQLPVLSLILPMEDLVGQEKGLLVSGYGILHPTEDMLDNYQGNGKWWRYPGNYHFRGKEWEREGELHVIDQQRPKGGAAHYRTKVRVRVNGNNTRGFADKALRLYLADDSLGYERLLLRSAGNDQDRMFMRDALQHNMCSSLPFDVMEASPVVLYINGAYWGIKYIRPRIDQIELARRYDLNKKHVTILEDMVELYKGKGGEVRKFWALVDSLETLHQQPEVLLAYAGQQIDLNNFLQYMAAQMILGNKDWPFQNLKYWKYTGPAGNPTPEADGRWRFIMGDSDLSFGYEGAAVADYDMFAHVYGNGGAIARLFKALMKHSELKEVFCSIVESQLEGPLSAKKLERGIDGMQEQLDAEMDHHIKRWHKPVSKDVWYEALAQGREYAERRQVAMRTSVNNFRQSKN